jgi:hypothetical protein
MKIKILAALALVLAAAGCKSGDKRLTLIPGDASVFHSDKKDESLETRLAWVKNKPKAVDLSVTLTNKFKKPILLKTRLFEGAVGGQKAYMIMPDEHIRLAPGQTYTGILALRYHVSEKRSGPGKLTMPVNEAPASGEGPALKTAVVEFPVNAVE